MKNTTLIEAKNLSKTFYEKKGESGINALKNINLKVKEGEFVVILGPSGCGKSTLLRILAGLEKPTKGEVFFDGEVVRGPSKKRGMVFQAYTSFPWLNVSKNVEFGLTHQKISKDKRRHISRRLIDMVGLHGFENSFPHQLSGGMKQRLAIARTLAMDPKALFLDEPFGAVDAQTRQRLQEELLNIQRETGKTIIFVTHDIDEALILGSRIIVLSKLPGRIIHDEQRINEKRYTHGYVYSDEFIIEKRKYARLIEQRLLRIGLSDWDGHAPIYYALDENFIPPQIDVSLGKGEAIRKQRFREGVYNCLGMTLNSLIELIPKNTGKIIFSTIGSINSGTDVLIVRKEVIQSIDDLKKARIGFALNSLEHTIFSLIFDRHKQNLELLSKNREQVVLTERRNYLTHLIENKIDAAILCEPAVTEIFSSDKAENFLILNTEIDQNLIHQVCYVSEESILDKKDLILKYLNFILDNSEYFIQNEQDILLYLHRKYETSREFTSFLKKPNIPYYLFENIKYYDLDENINFYLKGEILNILLKLSEIAFRSDIIEKEIKEMDLKEIIDSSFVETLAKEEELLD